MEKSVCFHYSQGTCIQQLVEKNDMCVVNARVLIPGATTGRVRFLGFQYTRQYVAESRPTNEKSEIRISHPLTFEGVQAELNVRAFYVVFVHGTHTLTLSSRHVLAHVCCP